MKIAELLQEAHIEPKHGELDLGIANGWSEDSRRLIEGLRKYRVDGSTTERNLGRCYNEYSFTINDGTDEYNVVYRVDSSD